MSRDSQNLERAIAYADFPALVASLYPDSGARPNSKHRARAVWRGGDGDSVAFWRDKQGAWVATDHARGESYNAYSFLTGIAGYSKQQATRTLLDAANLPTTAPKRTARPQPTTQPKTAASDISRWQQLPRSGSSEYLKRKQVAGAADACNAIRYDGKRIGVLMSAISNKGRLEPINVQWIKHDGGKLFGKGATRGAMSLIGANNLAALHGRVYVCEGLATGLSIHLATGAAVVVAFNAGNLAHVVKALDKHCNRLELIIAADNDAATAQKHGDNVGLTKALKAALTYGVQVCSPQSINDKNTDYNDLHAQSGLEAVRLQLTPQQPDAALASAKRSRKTINQLEHLVDRYIEVNVPHIETALDELIPTLPDNAHVLIDSGLGTRKTTWAAKYTQQLASLDGDDFKALILNHLQALSNQLASEDGFNGRCYLDMKYKDWRDFDELITILCLNSATKFIDTAKRGAGLPRFSVIFADEVDAMVHRLSDAEVTNAQGIFDTMKALIKLCGRFIGMSAYIDAAVIEFLRAVDPNRQIILIRNVYQPSQGTTFERLENSAHALELTDTKLGNDKRVAMSTNSDTYARNSYEYLTAKYPDKKILLVDAANKNEPAQQAFINNPVIEAQKYDCIIYTPVLGAGFSVKAGHGFELVAHLCSTSTAPQDSMQLLHRFRELDHMALSIDARVSYKPTDAEAIKQQCLDTLKADSDALTFDDEGQLTYRDDAFSRVHAANVAHDNTMRSDMRGNLIKLLEASGRQQVEARVSMSANAADNLKQAKTQGFETYCDELATADSLTPNQADYISRKNDTSYAEYKALQRFSLLAYFGRHDEGLHVDEVRELVATDRRGKLRRQVNKLVLARASDEVIQHLRRRELESFSIDPLATGYPDAKRTPFALQREFYQLVLTLANIDPETLIQSEPYTAESIKPQLETIAKNRRRYQSIATIPSSKKLLVNPCQWLGIQLRALGIKTKRGADGYATTDSSSLQGYVERRYGVIGGGCLYREKTQGVQADFDSSQTVEAGVKMAKNDRRQAAPDNDLGGAVIELLTRYENGDFEPKVRQRLETIFTTNPDDAIERLERAANYLNITGDGAALAA